MLSLINLLVVANEHSFALDWTATSCSLLKGFASSSSSCSLSSLGQNKIPLFLLFVQLIRDLKNFDGLEMINLLLLICLNHGCLFVCLFIINYQSRSRRNNEKGTYIDCAQVTLSPLVNLFDSHDTSLGIAVRTPSVKQRQFVRSRHGSLLEQLLAQISSNLPFPEKAPT